MSDKITMQKVFDAAWDAFVIKGRSPAVTKEDGICTYRDAKGNRCAVGLVMTDEQIDIILQETYSSHAGSIASVRTIIEMHPEWFDVPDGLINLGRLMALDSRFIAYASTFRHLQNELHDGLVKLSKNANEYSAAFPEDLESKYREVATTYNLTIPGETQERANSE
jgi:hypothetical protein